MDEKTKAVMERVVEEKRALDEKIGKLAGFINTPAYFGLSLGACSRLKEQLRHMQNYSWTLESRLKHDFN